MKKSILTGAISAGVMLANDLGTSNQPGQIYLANAARFDETYYSEPLTTYIVGWKDPNDIKGTLDFISPEVTVGRRFEYKAHKNAEEFLSETDDIRGIGSDFKRVEYRGDDVTQKTINKGLTIRLDLDQYPNIDQAQQIAVERLTRRLYRNDLRRAVAAAVAAAGNGSNLTWNTTAGKDPDQDMLTALIAANDDSGIRPNRLLFGEIAWNKRGLSHRAQNTAGGFASAMMTPDQLAGILGVEKIKVSRERYQTAATTKSKVVGDVVLGFYAEDGVGIDDPTCLKRFVSPVEGGGLLRVFVQQISAKLVDVTVEHYSNIIATASIGYSRLNIS